jgi:hypothetical protein
MPSIEISLGCTSEPQCAPVPCTRRVPCNPEAYVIQPIAKEIRIPQIWSARRTGYQNYDTILFEAFSG